MDNFQIAGPAKPQRILSIDIMRGLTLFLMLFVNDVYLPGGVPAWIGHTTADVDGMGLADWVFPGFLFMVGMSVPYAIQSRIKLGHSKWEVFLHILARTLSLLVMGVLIVNIERLNPELAGMNRYLWALLVYLSVFLVWNQYPSRENRKRLFTGLRVLGIIGLLVSAFIFRAGEEGNVSWLQPSWWGILGLIGWGYFVSATVGLCFGEKLVPIVATWIFFVILNVLDQRNMLESVDFLKPVFGVILSGNVPSIVLAGLVTSIILRRVKKTDARVALWIVILGLFCLALGFVLRQGFIISKIHGTPSWAMICNGISMLLYAALYMLIDYLGKRSWADLFQAAGRNSLTTYLAPDFIYFTCWTLNIPLFFYKQEASPLMAISGSVVWAVLMIVFAIMLSKLYIRLKM